MGVSDFRGCQISCDTGNAPRLGIKCTDCGVYASSMRVFGIIIAVLCGVLLQTAVHAQPMERLDMCASNFQLCRCDEECGLFDDCCPRCEIATSRSNEEFLFECRSTYLESGIVPSFDEAFWMVSACPEAWGDGLEETFIRGNCTDGPSNLAPVSDTSNGQIYKNEYCAICNGVMRIVAWRNQLACSRNLVLLANQPGFVLTREILERECEPCSFVQPQLSLNDSVARACYPRISSCLEQSVLEAQTGTPFNNVSYDNLVGNCTTSSGPYSLVSADSNVFMPFRNQYCAMCNGVNTGLSCYSPPIRFNGRTNACTSFRPATTEPPTDTPTESPTTTGPPTDTPTESPTTTEPPTDTPTESPTTTGPPTDTPTESPTTTGPPTDIPTESPTTTEPPIVLTIPNMTFGIVQPPAAGFPFSLVLDIGSGGSVVATSTVVTTNFTVTCSEGEVFHPPSGECRFSPCPRGFTQTGGSCSFSIVPSPDMTLPPILLGSGSGTSGVNCSGVLRTLDESEYQEVDNNTVLFGGEVVEIVRMDSAGRPVVCVNLTGNAGNVSLNCPAGQSLLSLNDSQQFEGLGNNSILFNDEVIEIVFNDSGTVFVCAAQNGTISVNTTVTLFSYPAGYFILTYIGCSLSVIGAILILLTHSLFKDLRTLPSKLLMNLSATILMSSLFILVGGPITAEFPNVNLCTSVAVILHFFFLGQFSWMSVMSFEMARTFNQALKLRTQESNRFKRILFIIYFLIGWGLPLLVTVMTVIVNFTTDGLVLYGVLSDGTQGRCWINHLESAIVAFVVPVCLSLLFNFTTFIVVSVYLFMASRAQDKVEKHNHVSYLRINLAIFTVSGLTWLFGFIAILAGTSWAWYVFIILNSSLGFVIFVAFLFTKKVLKLYLSLLRIRVPESILSSKKQSIDHELKNLSKQMQQSNTSESSVIIPHGIEAV